MFSKIILEILEDKVKSKISSIQTNLITFENKTRYFWKENRGHREALKCEVDGLEALAKTEIIETPSVLYCDHDILVTTFIPSITPTPKCQRELGGRLAKLHQVPYSIYGHHRDNFIGLSPQKNRPRDTWCTFFWENRLLFQLQLMNEKKSTEKFSEAKNINKKILSLERQAKMILESVESRPSALLHGDLWAGNFLCRESDEAPILIDPAVYYGDPEMDLALTTLFGGFTKDFFTSYLEENPIHDFLTNFQKRIRLYQLYHLLNHYNIFGDSYLGQIFETIDYLK